MRNDLKIVLFLAATLNAGAVLAETASESLTRIEGETLVLKAREKQLEAHANILSKQNEIAAKQQMHEALTQNASSGNPVIRSIEGIGNRMYAALQFGDGSQVDVQVGETLSNGMKIVSIRPNEVIVETGGKRRTRLASAAQHQPQTTPGFSNSRQSTVPPLPLPVFAPAPAPGARSVR